MQNLFAIVQGGLDHGLRNECLDEMTRRKDRVAGYAIGGLSGGEEKGNIFILHILLDSYCIFPSQIFFGECKALSVSIHRY